MCAFVGLYHERLALLRAWFIQHNGMDIAGRHTIHLLAHIHRGLEATITAEKARLLGKPTGTIAETIAAIEDVRDEMSRAGRVLADRYGFEYPADLEGVVRNVWSQEISSLTMALRVTSD